jgi:protein-disulfide isomerase
VTVLALPVSSRDHILGADAAATTLVEYGDFQCPRSASAHRIVREIQQQLGGKQLRFVFRHFPRTHLHPQAQQAAEATEAAAAQGKFWQMHDCLFENQHALDDGDLVECAVALGLDVCQFLKEMSADVHAQRVREDFDSGVQSGVKSTPSFFINGIRYDGVCDKQRLLAALC